MMKQKSYTFIKKQEGKISNSMKLSTCIKLLINKTFITFDKLFINNSYE